MNNIPLRLDVKSLSLAVDPEFHFNWQHDKLSVTDAGRYTHVSNYVEIWVAKLEPYLYSFSCYENIEVSQMVINCFWPGASSHLSSSLHPINSTDSINQNSLHMHAKWMLEEIQRIHKIEHPFVPKFTGFLLVMQDAQLNNIQPPLRSIYNLVKFIDKKAGTTDQHSVWEKVFAGVRICVWIIGSLFYIHVENLSLENTALVYLPVNLIIDLLRDAQEPIKEGALENTKLHKIIAYLKP